MEIMGKRGYRTLLQAACRSVGFCRSPVPRHELVDTALRPAVDEAREQVGKVDLRIDAVQLARLDQRCEVGPAAPALVRGGFIVPGVWERRWKSPTAFTRCVARL